MKLTGHLLYIDITQICGIGCGFCMYADKHARGQSMVLDELSYANLATLINDPEVKRISVSGEGEPLNNIATFHEILRLSEGGKAFEFITSGFLPHDQLERFYHATNEIVAGNGDTCNIRLSADSYHVAKVRHRAHGFSVGYALGQRPEALRFSFRSVDTDRAFTRNYLVEELAAHGHAARIRAESALGDMLLADSTEFGIEYKNHVHPQVLMPGEFLDFYRYIDAIEARYGKRFTLGSLNRFPQDNGMDVTVKPDGQVYFYGAEHIVLGNIHADRIDWRDLRQRLLDDRLLNALYSTPIVNLLDRISDKEAVRHAVARANNPYWVVKELVKVDGLLEGLVAA
ncbi:radical SAM protein [Massilia sp. Root351]|uniref:radical SAM protein n=1 Tax=Massilia sp. Root351 TaxID=1736522 RepID=UPI0007095F43|nr:radical SAM protein [Massilia sp. Root351]KQV83925.1 radical SAM protein [Massilia sp. Root351]